MVVHTRRFAQVTSSDEEEEQAEERTIVENPGGEEEDEPVDQTEHGETTVNPTTVENPGEKGEPGIETAENVSMAEVEKGGAAATKKTAEPEIEKTAEPVAKANNEEEEQTEAEESEVEEQSEAEEQSEESEADEQPEKSPEPEKAAEAEGTKGDGDGDRNVNENDEGEETESDSGGIVPYMPEEMWIGPEWYNETMKIATSCKISETVENLERILDTSEIKWFREHPQFRHFFHMPKETTHKTMGFFVLLIRCAKIVKKNELWFVVNGVPIRFSMMEHALISGLDCGEFPRDKDKRGDMSLVEKHFKNKKCTDADVKEKFLEMKKKTKDRLNVAILYFLTSVIKGNAKRGKEAPPSDRFLQRVASDAEFCRTFPWGRYTFNNNLDEVKKLLTKMDGKVDKEHVNFPGFITSLELLAFEAIPALMNEYREKVEVKEDEEEERLGCPRMCKTKFKHSSMKGWSTSDLYTAIGETKVWK